MSAVSALRWVHILAGAAWLGQVATISFVLVPLLGRSDPERQRWLLANLFPRLFRLASVLVVLVLTAGALLNLALTDWAVDWAWLTGTDAGRRILAGGSLGLLLGLFHFGAEQRLAPMASEAGRGIGVERMVRRLQVIPRIGLAVVVVVFFLMMTAAR
jgi:uncharacterized membrane protein